MKVMMLTAGQGTRLRPHTNHVPKPAIPFLNVPLFLYSVNLLKELNPSEFVFNTYHLPEVLKKMVSAFFSQGKGAKSLVTQFSDEQVLLGSGGGLGHARHYFQDSDHFLMVNGDEVILPHFEGQLKKAYEYHCESKSIATLIVKDHEEVGSKFGGVWVNDKNEILGFGKQTISGSNQGKHFIGVILFSKEIFNYIPEGESNILYDNIMSAIRDHKIARVYELKCEWFETGNEEDFLKATFECLELLKFSPKISSPSLFNSAPEKEGAAIYLQKLISLYAPNSILMSKNEEDIFFFDKSSTIFFDHLKGKVVVGANMSLPKNINFKNCVIDCVMGSSAHNFTDQTAELRDENNKYIEISNKFILGA